MDNFPAYNPVNKPFQPKSGYWHQPDTTVILFSRGIYSLLIHFFVHTSLAKKRIEADFFTGKTFDSIVFVTAYRAIDEQAHSAEPQTTPLTPLKMAPNNRDSEKPFSQTGNIRP